MSTFINFNEIKEGIETGRKEQGIMAREQVNLRKNQIEIKETNMQSLKRQKGFIKRQTKIFEGISNEVEDRAK